MLLGFGNLRSFFVLDIDLFDMVIEIKLCVWNFLVIFIKLKFFFLDKLVL